MFNFIKRIRHRAGGEQHQPEVLTSDQVIPWGATPERVTPVGGSRDGGHVPTPGSAAVRVPEAAEPAPIVDIAPGALGVTWTPPAGAPRRKWLRRLDDEGMVGEVARANAQGHHRGDPLSEPGCASLLASTVADLTTAYLDDYRVIGPQAAEEVAQAALDAAERHLAAEQRRHGGLIANRPSVWDTGPEAQARWVAAGHAQRALDQAAARVETARAAQGAAHRRVRIAATEAARALGASARQGASRLRTYHGAFNLARQQANHVALDALPDDLDEQLTVMVIRAARRGMNPPDAQEN